MSSLTFFFFLILLAVKMAEEDQPKEMFTKWFNVDRPWVVSKNQLYGNGDYESVHNIKNVSPANFEFS